MRERLADCVLRSATCQRKNESRWLIRHDQPRKPIVSLWQRQSPRWVVRQLQKLAQVPSRRLANGSRT
jgi:hypothetical protein